MAQQQYRTICTYDGMGERVAKAGSKLYWKGVGSTALMETNTSDTNPTRYIFFNGQRIARVDPGTTTAKYYVADNVGSTALETDYLGNILNESLFFPYGVERVIEQSDSANNYKFTGKERDAETGLDDFGAGYYDSNLGRFMTPDWDAKPTSVPYAKFGDPQTLNLYAYVENGPLNNVDADGHASADPAEAAGYTEDSITSVCELASYGEKACGLNSENQQNDVNQQARNDENTQQVNQQAAQVDTAQQQGLSSKSGKAIDKASKKYGYDASAFKAAMTQAGSKYKLNPNLLVGLGMRESSLNPSQSNGGLFQIQDPKAYGIDPKDIGNFEVQIPAAAAFLSGNISHFNGNVDLGVAAWTLGRGGTSHFFNEGGMPAVRGALLSAKHPDYGTVGGYVDFITSF